MKGKESKSSEDYWPIVNLAAVDRLSAIEHFFDQAASTVGGVVHNTALNRLQQVVSLSFDTCILHEGEENIQSYLKLAWTRLL